MSNTGGEVKSALKALGIDISDLSNSEFNSILTQAEKLAPSIVRLLGQPNAEQQIASFLNESNGLKTAANRIAKETKSTRLAHLSSKSNVVVS